MGLTLLPQSLSGPETGPSILFLAAGQKLTRFRFYGTWIYSPWPSGIPSDSEGRES